MDDHTDTGRSPAVVTVMELAGPAPSWGLG